MSRIDIVAPCQPFHDFWWPVSKPLTGHHDACAVVGFNDVPRCDIGRTVCADDLPIGTARKNATIELWSAHAAAKDADDTPLAIGCAAETGDAFQLCENRENGSLYQNDGNPLEHQLLTGRN